MTLSVSGLSVVRSGRSCDFCSLQPGERVGLVGASGSGKSTLGQLLTDKLREGGTAVPTFHKARMKRWTLLEPWRFTGEAEAALGLKHDTERYKTLSKALSIEEGDLQKRPWG